MNRITFSKLAMILMVMSFLSILISCNKEEEGTTEELSLASCEGCHTNYAHLQLVYSPDTAVTGGGCGGEAPHYEPYDRVYMSGEGYEAYKGSVHYNIGCVGCHNGVGDTDDKQLAHSGDFLRHPSEKAEEKCGSCHKEIVENFKTSIHNGTGQKRKVAMRSGLSGAQYFDQLPEHQIEGYNANCATCHGTCGNCHIVRPLAGGGGLANGHMFTRTPDMVKTCVVCHSSRGGHAYLGVAAGTQADVHLTSIDFQCKACHSGDELHGDGNFVDQRYAYDKLPKCEDCHGDLTNANVYHGMHIDDFNCQVCHSQDYNNCGSCHVHGEGARIPSYLDFKIAINPIPMIKKGYKFALVRRSPAAQDSWEKYGVIYEDFDALPTYNYTTPHNLLRWTSRTVVPEGSTCYTSCHIRNEGGELINRDLYLFDEDLLDWEKSASSGIVVDGKLPTAWLEE